ncbi:MULTISPECIES: LysR substrate-binding domain-containing protein [Salinivibrio]|jgi:DNA-binding transcriptional LysR family regulator|uniref:LysR substrate-binding domain-containing protein n=2 Tax=Salinivibrio TaxID=51366 RepID=A0ABY7LFZ9_9GAMM|nr:MULTISPECIES: LysR substrate-binding domain-containing protein [Salinivibrio]ODP99636.1 LysR family transcriptional regulator [Salinivibrio sp. DV]OOF15539.1 LysR family transcriptional regulator [Salinivibrio sp. PR932]OOF16361.1 LysR family transcriptional regulator [Salinivibrio sp. PR919]OOF21693.1 LysR family transcriptional regulator [Salinivibrio sp. IB574]OOF22141.1 LysR family transcriptional regulator [Salinivibrio proteolyticus]
MRYSLKQLAVFEAVAASGSVSRAADQLALTQSATSMALSQLEKLLGRPLFERQGKQMQLTYWGAWLRPKARQLLFDAQQIEAGFDGQHVVSGDIALIASQTAAEHLIPDLISIIDSDFPELRIDFTVKNTQKVIDSVRQYQHDLGIIEGRCDDSRLKQQVWCHDHLVVVAAKHHPYAQLDHVSLAQLEQAQWVLREPGAGTRHSFDSAIHGVIEDLDVRREYEQVPVLRTLVANSSYLSCLPYLDVEKWIERDELVALNVPELNMRRTLSFIWRADAAANPLRDCIIREATRMTKARRRDM